MHIIQKSIIILITFLTFIVLSLETNASKIFDFKTEHDKGIWIKKYFKGKKIFLHHGQDEEESKKTLEYKVIQDFINQRNIQNIEPIAVGKSILDTEIAKYNTACPDQKPIDKYKRWRSLYDRGFGGEEREQISKEELEKMYEEDKEDNNEFIDTSRCHGNIKIYKIDVAQDDKKEQYVLYCDDLVYTRSSGEWNDIPDAYYLLFDPKKCIYPKDIFNHWQYDRNVMHGIMKYKNQYYFYSYDESKSSTSKKYTGSIVIKSLLHNPNYEFFSAHVIIGE